MKFTPRPYQQEIIDEILEKNRVNVWAGMGLGKTAATLTALDILSLVETGPALVLAPIRVARSTWPDEAKKWDHLQHLKIQPIVGDPKQRRAALMRHAHVYTMNYDNLVWLVEHFGESWPFSTVVADESTKLKSYRIKQGGARAGALGKVAHTQVKRFINLTGTPSPNGMIDLWGQNWFVDKGTRLGKSFTAYTQRWFYPEVVNGGGRVYHIMKHSQPEIEARLRDVTRAIDPKDHFDLKEPIVARVEVELPEKAREIYDEMWKEMVAELKKERQITAVNAAGRSAKCRQIAAGAIYYDPDDNGETGGWEEIHRTKIEALEDILEEAAGNPVLVAYHWKHDLARLKKAIPQGRVLDKNPKTITDWNAGKIPVLFAHPASAGHGLNLQDGGNILAFFSHDWNLENHLQIIERIGPVRQLQAGHDRPVFIYHIVAKDTVDELMLERVETKRAVQDILLEAMK